MAADAQEISKVDSAVSGLSSSPKDGKHVPAKKRTSSSAPGVMNINDLGMHVQLVELHDWAAILWTAISDTACRKGWHRIADSKGDTEAQLVSPTRPHLTFKSYPPLSTAPNCMTVSDAICRKLNSSPSTIDDKEALKKMLTTPPVKKIDLHFPLGLEVTARNLKGVTIKDALDAIHKQFKKKVSWAGGDGVQ